jgi:hypothetical protein
VMIASKNFKKHWPQGFRKGADVDSSGLPMSYFPELAATIATIAAEEIGLG